ncbi:hypothetical protein Ddc_19767 [Ditylenchus destructor]|nr:hypothetical protein Ddc_19767 [Ditylenchus destructor]
MQIKSPTAVKLVSVSTPAAEIAEVHEMSMEGSVMRMPPRGGAGHPGRQAGRAQARQLSPDADEAQSADQGRRERAADAGLRGPGQSAHDGAGRRARARAIAGRRARQGPARRPRRP